NLQLSTDARGLRQTLDVVLGFGVAGFEAQRLFVGVERAGFVVLRFQHRAEVVPRRRVALVPVNDVAVDLLGFAVILLVIQREAHVGLGGQVVGRDFQQAVVFKNRVGITLLRESDFRQAGVRTD